MNHLRFNSNKMKTDAKGLAVYLHLGEENDKKSKKKKINQQRANFNNPKTFGVNITDTLTSHPSTSSPLFP